MRGQVLAVQLCTSTQLIPTGMGAGPCWSPPLPRLRATASCALWLHGVHEAPVRRKGLGQ